MRCHQDAEDFSGGVFEDEDTRTFYEVLPDLRFLVPGAMLDAADARSPAADADAAEAAADAAAQIGGAASDNDGASPAAAGDAATGEDDGGATHLRASGDAL